MQLVTDKSAGDPCALLPAVTLFGALKDGTKEQRTAVQNQIDDLMTVPRVAHGDGTGAISHRTNETQIWADFVSMVPPALAFYGVVNDNTTMIDMSIQQCLFYRDILATDKGWRHILLGKWQDTGLWATGNAWAAWGILRVYATIKQSHHAADYKDELEELSGIVADILNVSWSHRHVSRCFI